MKRENITQKRTLVNDSVSLPSTPSWLCTSPLLRPPHTRTITISRNKHALNVSTTCTFALHHRHCHHARAHNTLPSLLHRRDGIAGMEWGRKKNTNPQTTSTLTQARREEEERKMKRCCFIFLQTCKLAADSRVYVNLPEFMQTRPSLRKFT